MRSHSFEISGSDVGQIRVFFFAHARVGRCTEIVTSLRLMQHSNTDIVELSTIRPTTLFPSILLLMSYRASNYSEPEFCQIRERLIVVLLDLLKCSPFLNIPSII